MDQDKITTQFRSTRSGEKKFSPTKKKVGVGERRTLALHLVWTGTIVKRLFFIFKQPDILQSQI